MNALDNMFEGDEQIIHLIAEDQGPLSADNFRYTFNNACLQLAGLEDMVMNLHHITTSPIAPITNMSYMEH